MELGRWMVGLLPNDGEVKKSPNGIRRKLVMGRIQNDGRGEELKRRGEGWLSIHCIRRAAEGPRKCKWRGLKEDTGRPWVWVGVAGGFPRSAGYAAPFQCHIRHNNPCTYTHKGCTSHASSTAGWLAGWSSARARLIRGHAGKLCVGVGRRKNECRSVWDS